jgi:hypothetical protein
MTISMFQLPPQAISGQVLGKSYVAQFRDNMDYMSGCIDAWRPVPESVSTGYIGDETAWSDTYNVPIWDGWHLLRSDATLLHYYIEVSGTHTVKLYYDGVEVASGAGNSTYSLASKTPGFYRVHATMTRAGGTSGQTCYIAAPFTTYTTTTYTEPARLATGR